MTKEEAIKILRHYACLHCDNVDECNLDFCEVHEALNIFEQEPYEIVIIKDKVLDLCIE